jgi:hypothetical protein
VEILFIAFAKTPRFPEWQSNKKIAADSRELLLKQQHPSASEQAKQI